MTDTVDTSFIQDAVSGSTFEERLLAAASDYEMLDAESVAGVGL